MKENQLKRFYQSYIQAFAHYDIKWVRNCYQLPCVLSTPEKILVLNTEQDFNKEFNHIFSMLKENAISGFKADNASYQFIDENLVLVKIEWQFFDQANHLFTEFFAIYHLNHHAEQFKIINVISHDRCDTLPFEHSLKLSSKEK